MNRIVVTGMGVISAIGNTVEENRSSLIAGKCGISKLELFPSRFSGVLPVGEIKRSTAELQDTLDAYEPGVTRTSLLALHAMQEAIISSGLSPLQLSSFDTALVASSTVGGMCLTDEMHEDAKKDSPASPYIASYDYASVTMYLQQRFNMKGSMNTINTACSSSANAIMFGARLIRSGRARRAIVGGTDSLAKFTINGFNALHILSPETCTPFDEHRKGLNLGEGAAFLVLEREDDINNRRSYASLSGYSNANDAYHASSLSDEGNGPCKVMKEALACASLSPGQIGFVNAHGTGTENNDMVEGSAMQKIFAKVPEFASTKANTGHTLGAAGAIEAVYSVLNLAEQELYPAIGFRDPIASLGIAPHMGYRKQALEHVLSNSFGFGGNCSSLIFSKA